MPSTLFNRVRQYTGTTGTGTMTLSGAVPGYQTANQAGASGVVTVSYEIDDIGSAWEYGTGTYTSSGATLTRTVQKSSNANNPLVLSGSALVSFTALAADFGTGTITEVWGPNIPALSSFTQINVGSSGTQIPVTFIENAGVGVAIEVPDFSGNSRAFAALVIAQTAPYHAVIAMSGIGIKNTSGIAIFSELGVGFYDGSAEFLLLSLSARFGVKAAVYSSVTALGTTLAGGSNSSGGPFPPSNFDGRIWFFHVKNDSTNVYLGFSADGANPIWFYQEAISGGHLTSYNQVAIAFGVLSGAAAQSSGLGSMNALLGLFDTSGTRAPGPPGWVW